jgi:glucan endo-1,3-alpha-glucosidase
MKFFVFAQVTAIFLAFRLDHAIAAPASAKKASNITKDASDSPKMVFAHFMVGIVASYQASDWANDISLATASGIDGFALNVGADTYTETQLTLAYNAAGL